MGTTYRRFWISLGTWTLGLVAVFSAYWLLWGHGRMTLTPLIILEGEVGFFGTMLWLCLFPATLALGYEAWPQARRALPGIAVRVCVVALVAYGLAAFASPQIEYARVGANPDMVREERLPFGPQNLVGLLRHRAYAAENPPEIPRHSVDTPLQLPVNHLDNVLHGQLAAIVFGVLSGLLGLLVGLETVAMRARYRRWLHWVVGLSSPIVFIGGEGIGTDMMLHSASVSGVLTGWLPIVPHMVAVALLVWHQQRLAQQDSPGGSGGRSRRS